MEITIHSTETGQELSLLGELVIIPEGYTLLICPRSSDHYFTEPHRERIAAALQELGIRAHVAPIPLCVWAVKDAE